MFAGRGEKKKFPAASTRHIRFIRVLSIRVSLYPLNLYTSRKEEKGI